MLLYLYIPWIDGLQAMARIREISAATPAIVISGAGTMGDVVEALRLGAWDYQTKPIEDMELLGHALRRAVERMTMLRERDAYQERLEGAGGGTADGRIAAGARVEGRVSRAAQP